jgi:dTDP-4-amino-4,6-dideoxygalactose transaminase
MRVPLVDLAAQEATVADEALAAVAALVREGRFVLGARVEAFERWLADTCGVAHAIGVASGTDAIELGLRALGVGPGDAVVTPAFSFVAAAEAIAATGAHPVFCDIDACTMNASAATIDEAIDFARRSGLRVRAMVPTHLFGRCAPMHELSAIAEREGLVIVEDAAQALGAREERGRAAGAGSNAGCFSFFPTKNLGAWGDAGAVVTPDARVAERVRRLRTHGAVSPYIHAEPGRNSRLDALQAVVLLTKARHLAQWQDARARIASRYLRDLARLPLVLPVAPEAPAVHAWHAFVVQVPDCRDALASWLEERGVETRVYYPLPLHRQTAFRAMTESHAPRADEASRVALALPIFSTMTQAQQSWVVEQVARFFGQR